MQENKYFTPSIEDIRVGYECEIDDPFILGEDWRRKVLDKPHLEGVLRDGIQYVRVPYLTKEQIEAEGWKKECFLEYEENEMCCFKKDKYECRWWGKPDYIEFHNTRTKNDIIYEGKCKDINTFRYICKLLGI